MALFSTESDVSAFVTTVYEQALTVARERTFMNQLVTVFGDKQGLAPRTVTSYGTATIVQVGETDDIASQAIGRTSLSTLTPAEFGASYLITDSRVETDQEQVRRDAAIELGMAMADSMEAAIIGDFASLTGGTVGAAGSTALWGHLFAAQTILRKNKVPGPYAAVLHPYQWFPIAKAVTPAAGAQTNAPGVQDQVTRDNFFITSVAGLNIFVSANVPIDSSDDAVGAVFGMQALALDIRRAPRLEYERDASRRAWETVLTAVYAHGIWRPTYGVQFKSDASTPTF
jgi:hypothetical protein